MTRLALLLLLFAVFTATAGYYGVTSTSWERARIVALVSLVLAVLAFLAGDRRSQWEA
jgi:uncharacterized membrane protein YtjA (UPF0391 family)